MFNLLDAAKTVLNSVSSTNLFPWNFIDSNHGPFQSSSQMTRQTETRSLERIERKRKKEQIESNLTKKMKPTPIIEEAFSLPLQLVPETVAQSPQLSSYTCSHTPPASPLQSPLQSPIKSTKSPIYSPEQSSEQSSVQSSEKTDKPKLIIEEVILSSATSTPTSQTRGSAASLRSSPLCTHSKSPLATSEQPPLKSPENHHQSITVIEEVILSSPSCARSRSPSISPKKPNQPTTSLSEDLVSSLPNSTPQAIETKQLSPSKLSTLSLQNLNFFSNNLKLLNKLTEGDFNYNQFKDELKSPFDIIMFYLLVEGKTSLNAASLINLFPWNFDVFHIGIYPHEPYQVFSSIHGNLPLPEKTVRHDFQRKVSIVVIKNRKRFICTNSLCNHGDEKFPKKENIVIHLYKKYVLFVCLACGAMFHEKCTLGVHQASHCRFKKKSKTLDDSNNDIKKADDEKAGDDNEKNVDIKTEEEVFKILIQTALNRAHEDGLLIQFEKIDALLTTLSTDFKAMSFLVLLSSIIMCQEGKYGLERDELQCHDDYYKIWMDTERCFQIVELATKKAISIEILESRLKRSVGKEGDSYVCKYPFCRCSGEFKRNSKSEIISHIEQSNYRLVCCGCHSSFKVISSLIRHSNESCKHSKLLDKMKEAAKKY